MKIAVTSKTLSSRADFIGWLKSMNLEVMTNDRDSLKGDDLVAFLKDADLMVLGTERVTSDQILNRLPKLKAVFKYGVGIDNVDFVSYAKQEIPVFFLKGTNSVAVAEITVSYIIQLLRNQHVSFHAAKNNGWKKTIGKEISEARIGILGYGNVGSTVGKILTRISPSVDIWGCDVDSTVIPTHVSMVNDEKLFTACDIVTVHIDNDESGKNDEFIGERLLSKMSDGSYLVNTARGSIVDYTALQNHLPRLGGVAFDVYPNEPSLPGFLVNNPKAITSCHICGSSTQALSNGEEFIKKSIASYLENK